MKYENHSLLAIFDELKLLYLEHMLIYNDNLVITFTRKKEQFSNDNLILLGNSMLAFAGRILSPSTGSVVPNKAHRIKYMHRLGKNTNSYHQQIRIINGQFTSCKDKLAFNLKYEYKPPVRHV